jgi:hypothetical protein
VMRMHAQTAMIDLLPHARRGTPQEAGPGSDLTRDVIRRRGRTGPPADSAWTRGATSVRSPCWILTITGEDGIRRPGLRFRP